MTVTSGFFNSVNHDRLYDAEQISSMFDGIITDGVYQGYGDTFEVMPVEDMNNTVTVGTGRAWFNHTWTLNDTPLVFTLESPNTMLSRIDAIVLDINKEDSTRKNQILKITGEYAESTPAQPTLINNELHKQYPLAYISVPAGQPGPIKSYQITNMIGTASCPLVAGLFETMDLDVFIAQMNSEFDEWFNHIQTVIDDDVVLNLQNQIDGLAEDIQEQSGITLNTARDYSTLPYDGSYNTYDISSAFYYPDKNHLPYDPDYNDTFNVQSYIDENGTYMFLFADFYSTTRVDYKFVKVTKDGTISTSVLKQNTHVSNNYQRTPYISSGICKGHDGNVYGAISAFSLGTTASQKWYAPLTIYNLSSDTPTVVYEDTAGLFANCKHDNYYTSTNNVHDYYGLTFFYNEKYSIYVYRINGAVKNIVADLAWYRFSTSFAPVFEAKPVGQILASTKGEYAYVGVCSGNSDDAVSIYKESLNPSTWSTRTATVGGCHAFLPMISSPSKDYYVGTGTSYADMSTESSMASVTEWGNTYINAYEYSDNDIENGTITRLGGFVSSIPARAELLGTRTNISVYKDILFGASESARYYNTYMTMDVDPVSYIPVGMVKSFVDNVVAFPVITGFKISQSNSGQHYNYLGYAIYNTKTGQSGLVIPNYSTEWIVEDLHLSPVGEHDAVNSYNTRNGFYGYATSITANSIYTGYTSFQLLGQTYANPKIPYVKMIQVHFDQNM